MYLFVYLNILNFVEIISKKPNLLLIRQNAQKLIIYNKLIVIGWIKVIFNYIIFEQKNKLILER